MKSVLLLSVAICGLYAAPALIENASGQCEAVVRRMNRMDPTGANQPAFVQALTVGAGTFILARMAEQRYRALPSSVTCAGGYWWGVVNPDGVNGFFVSEDRSAAYTAEQLLHMTPQEAARLR